MAHTMVLYVKSTNISAWFPHQSGNGKSSNVPSKAPFIGKVDLHLQRLLVIPADPLVAVPRHDLDRGRLVKRHGRALADHFLDFARREHAGRAGALAAPCTIAELASSPQAAWVLHRETWWAEVSHGVPDDESREWVEYFDRKTQGP